MRPYDTEPPNTKLRATQICRSAQQPTKEPQLSKRGAWRLAIVVGTLFPTASLMITVRLELVERGSFDVHQVLQWRSKPESSTAGPVGPSASGDRACTLTSNDEAQVHAAPRTKVLSDADRTRYLNAGQSATFGPGGSHIETVGREEVERRFTWAKKVLYFDGTLADAVAEFNRYNVRKLEIDSDSLKSMHIAGRFEASDPGSFVEALSRLGIAHSVVPQDAPVDVPIRLSEK
jgi:hypothetical protein